MNLLDYIARDLVVPDLLLKDAVRLAHIHVKKFHIKKRSGGRRLIEQPSKKLKVIQYWLIQNVLSEMDVSANATAYLEGASIKDNASRHKSNRYFVKMDFKDFFPSLTWSCFDPVLMSWHGAEEREWILDEGAKKIIRAACFGKDDALPIGYPTSPYICNIVLKDFDESLDSSLKSFGYKDVVYTRYADDLVVSTNTRGVSQHVISIVEQVINNYHGLNLKLNERKTKAASAAAGSAFIAGLRICRDERLTVHKKMKDHVRLLLSLHKRNMLKEQELNSLKGYINYIRDVDPLFYTKITTKYFGQVGKIMGRK